MLATYRVWGKICCLNPTLWEGGRKRKANTRKSQTDLAFERRYQLCPGEPATWHVWASRQKPGIRRGKKGTWARQRVLGAALLLLTTRWPQKSHLHKAVHQHSGKAFQASHHHCRTFLPGWFSLEGGGECLEMGTGASPSPCPFQVHSPRNTARPFVASRDTRRATIKQTEM